MSPNRRVLLGGSLLAAGGLLLGPMPAAAHAIGQAFTLPVPLTLYLTGAGLAVAASFVVSVVVVRPASGAPRYPTLPVPATVERGASVLLQGLGLVWWVGTIVLSFAVDASSPLPVVLFWVGMWVGLPIAAVVLGNAWPSLSPFRTLYAMLEWAARLLGLDRLDAGLAYPRSLARWPAVAFLFIAIWGELIMPGKEAPDAVGRFLLGYTLLTLLGMLLFGRVAWLRNAELFEVLLGWFGRIGPLGRRVVQPTACAGCTEACDPARCIDCPECATAAEPNERRVELRPWFAGLTEVRGSGWSDAAFIVLALAGVTYDGLQVTGFWGSLNQPIYAAALPVFGALNTVIIVPTGGLLAVWLAFLTAFSMAARLTRNLHDPARRPAPLGSMAGSYAATLLPIAGGYLIAHYLTELIQVAVWLPTLLANPLANVAPSLDWIPVSAFWYLSVGAIVIGHIVAVVLAHRIALRDSPLRPVLAGLPMVILMVGYTVLSLWIIAAPITIDPDAVPAVMVTLAVQR
jgi:hypothetical protein